mgnify:CR=1 FL=1
MLQVEDARREIERSGQQPRVDEIDVMIDAVRQRPAGVVFLPPCALAGKPVGVGAPEPRSLDRFVRIDADPVFRGCLEHPDEMIDRELAKVTAEADVDAELAAGRVGALINAIANGRCVRRLQQIGMENLVARELPLILPPRRESGPIGAVVGFADLVYRDPDSGALVVAVSTACSDREAVPALREPEPVGGPALLRRLTESQYRATVADIFGPQVPIVGRFERALRTYLSKVAGCDEVQTYSFDSDPLLERIDAEESP